MSEPVAPLASLAGATAEPTPPAALDSTDRELLRLLAVDARMSQRRLGRELGMSPPAVGERISRLEQAGVIRGYSVSVDWAALGYPVTVYLSITATAGSDLGEVIESLRRVPEVERVNVVTGSIDLLACLRVRDYTHLRALLLEQVWHIRGVQRTETLLGIAEMHPKDFTAELIAAMGTSDQE